QSAMQAVESSRSCILLCDADFNILYANTKSREMLAFMEPNLHKFDSRWQNFRAANIIGDNLEFLFTDEPLEFRRASDPRNLPYQAIIRTGPCVCDVQITALVDDQGDFAGYAVDWERITDKVAQEKRIKQLTQTLEYSEANTFLCDLDWNVLYAN